MLLKCTKVCNNCLEVLPNVGGKRLSSVVQHSQFYEISLLNFVHSEGNVNRLNFMNHFNTLTSPVKVGDLLARGPVASKAAAAAPAAKIDLVEGSIR